VERTTPNGPEEFASTACPRPSSSPPLSLSLSLSFSWNICVARVGTKLSDAIPKQAPDIPCSCERLSYRVRQAGKQPSLGPWDRRHVPGSLSLSVSRSPCSPPRDRRFSKLCNLRSRRKTRRRKKEGRNFGPSRAQSVSPVGRPSSGHLSWGRNVPITR